LYDGYQRRYYYWGVVELVAKLALVLNEMVFSFDSALVLMANVLVLFIYFVAHSSCQPFCVDAADKQKEVENYDRELAGLQHVVTARNRIRRKLTQSSALWKSRSAAWLKLFSKCNLVESACLMAVMWLNLGALFVTALKASGRRMLLIVVSSICALVLAVFFFYCFCTISYLVHYDQKQRKQRKADDCDKDEEEEDDGDITFVVGNPVAAGPKSGTSAPELLEASQTIQQLQAEVHELKKKIQASALKSYQEPRQGPKKGQTARSFGKDAPI
jgi:hypothetical protein